MVNKRILFVCGEYYPYPSANGVCVTRLQEVLLNRGIVSDVICIGEPDGKEQISRFGVIRYVSNPFNVNQNIMGRTLNKIKVLRTWPVKNTDLITKYAAAILEMRGRFDYDLIISVMRPIEGALACCKSGEFILYELDSITNNFDNLYGIKKLLSYRAYRIETKIYKKASKIIHLGCHKDFYSNSKYEDVCGKFIYTDIPHLVLQDKQEKTVKAEGVHIIFTGALVRNRNSPEYAIRLIEGLSSKMEVQCEFYSRGNCEDMLKEKSIEHPDIFRQRGYVSQEELKGAIKNADMFLSIGSHLSSSVTSIPSKVIEYMASGKPIIHILGINDTAISYLDKYGNAVVLDENDSYEDNLSELEAFVRSNRDRLIDVEELRKKLPMNTPEWTVEKMIEDND